VQEKTIAHPTDARLTHLAVGSSFYPDSESRRQGNHEPTKAGIPRRKKTHSNARLSCKIECLLSPRNQSGASNFITGD
jgi:hypothetical protein